MAQSAGHECSAVDGSTQVTGKAASVSHLQRKRVLAAGVVGYWAQLCGISLVGAAWLCLLCFWTVKASVSLCSYVVNDKPAYNPEDSAVDGIIELMKCRLTLKNFAWNQHWLMFVPYGVLKELYDLMLPVIFTLGMYGTRLQWRWTRKLFFTVGIPCIVCGFMAVWHVGLGQPGVMRVTMMGQLVFYTLNIACFVEMSRLLHRLDSDARVNVHWLFIMFGLVVVFPTYIYKIVITYAMWGRGGSGKNKLAMRVLVHPVICEVAMGILRNFARQMRGARGGMGSLLFVVLLVTRSIYGRFLLLQVQNVGSVTLLQVSISLMDCIVRMCTKDMDALFVKVLYGARTAEAIQSSEKNNELLVFEQQISMLAEYSAMVAVPAFMYAGNITLGGVPADVRQLMKNAVTQVAVQAIIDLLAITYDVFYHNIDHLHVWATRRDKAYLKYLAIHFTAHGLYIFYNSIFSLFCPLWDYETKLPGLRMDHCEMMPALDPQSILPQYFPLKHFPNYAPGAAAPLISAPDMVWYESVMNPAVCRGISPLENCMLDLFPVPVHPKPLP